MGRKLLKRSCEWRLVVEVSFFFHIVDSADYAIGICEKNFDKLLDNLNFILCQKISPPRLIFLERSIACFPFRKQKPPAFARDYYDNLNIHAY
jgi:hypothetical protein